MVEPTGSDREGRVAHQPASTLVRQIADGVISSRELLEIYLDRIERLNPDLNAIVTVDAASARRQADAADEMIRNGDRIGPLHGLPMTVKDTLETAGMRTTSGAPELAQHIPGRDAEAVARLRVAGAIVLGKSNTAMYASDAQTTNPVFGTTNNPWALDRSPGGSSGGAAAAVAAGLTGLELGSELSGSARLPAHYSGVYALRPTHGLIPTVGNIPRAPGSLLSNDMVTLAPIARAAEDLELALEALAGPVAAEAVAWQLRLPEPRATRLRDYRVGVWLDDPSCPVDRQVTDVLSGVVDALAAAGARVSPVRPVDLAAHNRLYEQLLYGAISLGGPEALFDQHCDSALTIDPDDASARAGMTRGLTQRHRHWLQADERRARVRAGWIEYFTEYDVLICPVSPVAAIEHDHHPDVMQRQVIVNGGPRPYWDQIGWTSLATAGALPAASVPVGLTAGGLPVGLQIVGPHLHDRTVCDMARQLSRLTGGYQPPPLSMNTNHHAFAAART